MTELVAPAAQTLARAPKGADELAAAWLLSYSDRTRQAYAADLRAWAGWLRSIEVDPLAAQRWHVDAWAEAMEAEGLAPATRARRLYALASFYRYAVDEGACARSPVVLRMARGLARRSTPTPGLDAGEVRELLRTARSSSARNHALVALLALTGIRISEAVGADVGDLSAERGHRTLTVTRKGGARVMVPLAPPVWHAIDGYLDGRSAGPLFLTRRGGRLSRQGAETTLYTLTRRALGRALPPHSLRVAFATSTLDAGASLRDVQDAMGHSDPRTTRAYDRRRNSLDRHPTYLLAAHLDGDSDRDGG